MGIAYIVLMVIAFACFLAGAAGVGPPRWNLMSLGLAFWALAELITHGVVAR